MKRISSIILAAIMLVAVATCSLGAIHNVNGDFIANTEFSAFVDMYAPKTVDTWYTIAPDGERVTLLAGSITDLGNGFTAEYYLNDQTFVSLGAISSDSGWVDDFAVLKGSYLFDFGFFVGLEIGSSDGYNATMISPGYRFSFGDDSYLAFSLDYLSDDADFDDILDYEVAGKYFSDTMKLFGQVLFPQESSSDMVYLLGANFQVSDAAVVGLKYFGADDYNSYSVGMTWTTERFILDLEFFADSDEDNYYELGGMFMVNEALGIGLGYLQEDQVDDARISAKFKYVNEDNQFSLIFLPENDSYYQAYYLTYEMKF